MESRFVNTSRRTSTPSFLSEEVLEKIKKEVPWQSLFLEQKKPLRENWKTKRLRLEELQGRSSLVSVSCGKFNLDHGRNKVRYVNDKFKKVEKAAKRSDIGVNRRGSEKGEQLG